MTASSQPCVSAQAAPTGPIDTLLFVDVDGVLNIGACDSGEAPLLLSQDNIEHAERMWGQRFQHSCIEKIISVSKRTVGHGGDTSTYGELACSAPCDVSEVLVGRLVELIRSAGQRRLVVLSSNWRFPRHDTRRRRLEQVISRHLKAPFTFDKKTLLVPERRAADRLRCIGDFIADFTRERADSAPSLRILVIEDFFITSLNGWSCDGTPIGSVCAAENYLKSRARCPADVAVKLQHTYDEWITSSGQKVQIGAGLTIGHLSAANEFLSQSYDQVSEASFPEANVAPQKEIIAPQKESITPQAVASGTKIRKTGGTKIRKIVKAISLLQRLRRFCMEAFGNSYMEYLSAVCPMISIYPPCAV